MIHLDPPWLAEDIQSGLPILLVAMGLSERGAENRCYFLTVDMEGRMRTLPEDKVRADYRWTQAQGWHDATPPQPGPPSG